MAGGERPEAADVRRNGRPCSAEPTKVSGSVGATVAGMSAKLSAILPRDLCVGLRPHHKRSHTSWISAVGGQSGGAWHCRRAAPRVQRAAYESYEYVAAVRVARQLWHGPLLQSCSVAAAVALAFAAAAATWLRCSVPVPADGVGHRRNFGRLGLGLLLSLRVLLQVWLAHVGQPYATEPTERRQRPTQGVIFSSPYFGTRCVQ